MWVLEKQTRVGPWRRIDLRIAALAISLAAATAGCVHVAPYQRAQLAHPMMTADGLEGPAVSHVLAVQEGATGGGSLAESGCGCN